VDGVRSLPSGSCERRWWWRRRRCGRVVTVERSNRLIRTNMGHASSGIAKFFGFEFSSSVEVAFPMPCKSVESRPGSLVPGVERIGIGLPQLFLCGQAIRKFFKSYVRGDRSHAPDQNNQHPFHNSVPRSSNRRANNVQMPPRVPDWPMSLMGQRNALDVDMFSAFASNNGHRSTPRPFRKTAQEATFEMKEAAN
jgi:hypothetical protein